MDDWKAKIAERLAEVFQGETQYVTATKLNTTQGNISKWLNGTTPTVDTCRDIARVYDVSVDWLLGLSDKKHSDDISVEKLTYEQVARIIDRLLDNGTISIPDMNEIKGQAQFPEETDEELLEEEDSEEYGDGDIVLFPSITPDYDSDYLKVNDRVLSYMLRRRQKIYDIGADFRHMWQDNSLPNYRGIRLLSYVGNMEAAIDTNSWPNFNSDGDWVALIQKLSNMTEEERAALIENAERAKAKRKA